jgi:VanZ family protein
VLWFWIGLGLCAVFIYGCLTPNPPSGPAGVPQFDKFEHAFAFFVMGAWFGALFRYAQLRVLIVLSLFGAVMEVVQWSIGYRDGDPWDWVADAAGIVIGLSFLWLTGVDWVARVEHLVKATGN